MNAHIPQLGKFATYASPEAAGLVEATTKPRELKRLIALHIQLEHAHVAASPMPEDLCGSLGQVIDDLAKFIIAAPITCIEDVADKFRFAATLMEDEGGMLYIEPDVAFGALSDLIKFRDTEWNDLQPGIRHPSYARFQIT